MTMRTKIELAAAAVLLVAIAMGLTAYIHEREDRIRAEVTVQAKQGAIQERDQQTAQQIAELRAQVAAVKTPQQATQQLPTVIQLPAPVRTLTEDDVKRILAGQSQPTKGMPDAPTAQPVASGDLVVPKNDIVPLYSQLASCKENELKLTACQADKHDVESQRDVAVKAMKGGSLFTRVKREAKWLAIGAAAGAIAAKAR